MMRRLLVHAPRLAHRGIQIAVADAARVSDADQFIKSTAAALDEIVHVSPGAYAALQADVEQIILWSGTPATLYHRFQRAILVPPTVALGSSPTRFGAWLLAASGMAHDVSVARKRVQLYLRMLSSDEREAVRLWLSEWLPSGVMTDARQ